MPLSGTLAETVAEVSVIVVNYGTADLALAAVESVLMHRHGGRSVDIHLVDNASPDDSASVLAREIATRGWSPRVTLYAERENHGFGRGNNLVLARLAQRPQPPDYIFLLNPDARLENEAIAILADLMDGDPAISAAGAGISKPGHGPVTAAFRYPNLAGEFSASLSFGPVSRLLRRFEAPLPPDQPQGPVDWVAGAAVLMRRSAVEAAGRFHPGYFLYYEEVDLMRQLTRRGGQILYVPQARVIHSEGAATGVKSGEARRKRRPAYWYRSWQIYFRRVHGRGYALAAGAACLVGAMLNAGLSALRGREPAAPLNFVADFWTHAMQPLLAGKVHDNG